MKPVRVLPAVVYDFLEFSALAFGGIGAGPFTVKGCSNCAFGHAGISIDPYVYVTHPEYMKVAPFLHRAGVWTFHSDRAVRAINKRRHRKYLNARVTFKAWCKELGVVRGE